MANEEEKTVVEGGAETKAPKEGGKKTGLSSKLVLFGGIGMGAIVLGVALAMFVIQPMMSGSEAESGVQTAEIGKNRTEQPKKKRRSSVEGGKAAIYSIKNIVINPAGTGGSRFLSASISFELESGEAQRQFEDREPIIRDALITILSSKTVAQLTDPKQKEITRYQIKKRVSQLMETEEVAGVYYTDFVLQ